MVLANFPLGKKVLSDVNHRDVAVMRMFGKNIHDCLVIPTLVHQIVHHQQSTTRRTEPLVQIRHRRDPFVKMNLGFGRLGHLLEFALHGPITIVHVGFQPLEIMRRIPEKFGDEHRLTAIGRSGNQHAARCLEELHPFHSKANDPIVPWSTLISVLIVSGKTTWSCLE